MRYNRFGFFSNKHNTGNLERFTPVINVNESSNSTSLEYTIDTNLTDQGVLYYEYTGNVTGTPFTEPLSGNVNLDVNGNATITTTLNTSNILLSNNAEQLTFTLKPDVLGNAIYTGTTKTISAQNTVDVSFVDNNGNNYNEYLGYYDKTISNNRRVIGLTTNVFLLDVTGAGRTGYGNLTFSNSIVSNLEVNYLLVGPGGNVDSGPSSLNLGVGGAAGGDVLVGNTTLNTSSNLTVAVGVGSQGRIGGGSDAPNNTFFANIIAYAGANSTPPVPSANVGNVDGQSGNGAIAVGYAGGGGGGSPMDDPNVLGPNTFVNGLPGTGGTSPSGNAGTAGSYFTGNITNQQGTNVNYIGGKGGNGYKVDKEYFNIWIGLTDLGEPDYDQYVSAGGVGGPSSTPQGSPSPVQNGSYPGLYDEVYGNRLNATSLNLNFGDYDGERTWGAGGQRLGTSGALSSWDSSTIQTNGVYYKSHYLPGPPLGDLRIGNSGTMFITFPNLQVSLT
jgi:hypothetical protein